MWDGEYINTDFFVTATSAVTAGKKVRLTLSMFSLLLSLFDLVALLVTLASWHIPLYQTLSTPHPAHTHTHTRPLQYNCPVEALKLNY